MRENFITGPQPLRLAQKIQTELSYGSESTAVEFTLRLWKKELEKVIKNAVATEDDYISLGLVLFNLRKYDEFNDVLENSIRIFKSLRSLTNQALGQLNIQWQKKNSNQDKEIVEKYFQSRINPEQFPFHFGFGVSELHFSDFILPLKINLKIDITVNSEFMIHFKSGPISFSRFSEQVSGPFLAYLLEQKIILDIQNDTLKKSIENYLSSFAEEGKLQEAIENIRPKESSPKNFASYLPTNLI
ncbi:hypothetical protein [Leptospira sarikeiensis]|uniref:Uncharacterized protein n=1 Tax=Leptospira sarikeiensis TaxID=2484943 RepID=A0A4R9K354_9LEPT|nr:hypothetical protein [Leptospira sarikeiensis]TGL60446.1 hypothetical protein EHQ64_11425 [Leptospira sarikeiensis]